MELRTLRYFLAAAQEGNITKAAELLHITQPTLSRQMMDLEKEIGTSLMLRGKNGLSLTDDGIFFRQRAEEIVELADRLEQAFVERNADVNGVIAIGATEAVGGRLFAKIIKKFSDKYPLVQFDLYNEMADNIVDRIDKGLIDVGLLLEPVDTEKYDFVRLSQKETWGVLMRDDHPLAKRAFIVPEEIKDYPLILPSREKVHSRALRKICGFRSAIRCCPMRLLLVEEGLGCAFCAGVAHWLFTAAPIYVLCLSVRSIRHKVYWHGKRSICFLRQLHCLYRKLICCGQIWSKDC